MIISCIIDNPAHKLLGAVRIRFDWINQTWSIEKDLFIIWQKISLQKKGSFKKSGDAVWILDEAGHPLLIFHHAPKNASDKTLLRGTGKVAQSMALVVKSEFQWSVYSHEPPKQAPLTPIRKIIVARLTAELKGAGAYGSATYPKIAKPYGKASVGTNCYIMGSIIPAIIGEMRGIKDLKAFVERTNLTAIREFRKRCRRGDSWVNAYTSKTLPRPGDIFALLHASLDFTEQNCETGLITHVGAIIELKSSREWITADFGQTLGTGSVSGNDGMLSKRTYEAGWLTDDPPSRGQRVLAGWSDIDTHFSNLK